jgi:hypothetical protein
MRATRGPYHRGGTRGWDRLREITAEQNAPPPPPPSADEATGESGDEGGGEPMDL